MSSRTTKITAIAKYGARNSALGWRGIAALRALGAAVDDFPGSGSWLDIEDGLISSLRVTVDPGAVAARP